MLSRACEGDARSGGERLSTAVPWISGQVHEPSRRIPGVIHRRVLLLSRPVDRLTPDVEGHDSEEMDGMSDELVISGDENSDGTS